MKTAQNLRSSARFRPDRLTRESGSGRRSSAALPSSLFAGLLVVRMLLELTQKSALLDFQVKSLKRAIDAFAGLNNNVNQT